jgi:6-phosphofructokinase 1
MKRIAVMTSGGDSPGMNAAIRGVTRAAISRGVEVIGFYSGYSGIHNNEFIEMKSTTVGGIITHGGTILRTARCKEMRTPEGRERVVQVLRDHKIQGLVIIGGDGSITGGEVLRAEFDFPVIGVPSSIDNDIYGSDYSIGFDTAVNTALDATDKIRDTAYSHDRVFVVEVMGRNNGFIALNVAVAAGAEAVIIPEAGHSIDIICKNLTQAREKGKASSLIIVAEGAATAYDMSQEIGKKTGFETRFIVLGHTQRGGSPTAFDRILALTLSVAATERLISGHAGEIVGIEGSKLVYHPINDIVTYKKEISPFLLNLVGKMSI